MCVCSTPSKTKKNKIDKLHGLESDLDIAIRSGIGMKDGRMNSKMALGKMRQQHAYATQCATTTMNGRMMRKEEKATQMGSNYALF